MRNRTLGHCTLVLVLVLSLSSAIAQEVRQGTFGAAGSTQFKSPMVLTVPFAATDSSIWGRGGWWVIDEYKKIGKFTCDGVSIRRDYSNRKQNWVPGLELSVRTKGPDLVQVKARVSIYNPEHNHDKAVTVLLEVLDGDQVVQTATVGPILAKDNGGEEDERASMLVPTELLRKQPSPTLRLTVDAENF